MKRKKIVVPLPQDLKRKLDALRQKEGVTIVGFVNKILREALGGRVA